MTEANPAEQKAKDESPQGQLAECQKQKADYLAGWQRARADLLNYKKEEQERFESFGDIAREAQIMQILPMVDDFNKAAKEWPERLKGDPHLKGILQIRDKLCNLLKEQGVEKLKVLGQKFDPNLHETVGEAESGGENGTITEEIEAGYMRKGRLLRPAKVRVVR